MKGYKGYSKGLICAPTDANKKQYAENTVFEEDAAKICTSGMHFCENPLDVLDYYPLIDKNGDLLEITDVEALDEPKTNDKKKFCTKKLKVGVKLSLPAFIKAAIDFIVEKTDIKEGDYAQLASSGYSAQLASSGDYAQLASAGDFAQLASAGDSAQLASAGDSARLASAGYSARLASAGNFAQLASAGDSARLASAGDSARLASAGDFARLASSGYSAQLASSGNSAQLASSGNFAQLASAGNSAQLASSGNFAQLASAGDFAKLASSGNSARLASSGYYAVIAGIGFDNIAKGKKGSWLTLAEWEYSKEKERYIPISVKTEQIDGEKLKEDTSYKLQKGEFVEVKGE